MKIDVKKLREEIKVVNSERKNSVLYPKCLPLPEWPSSKDREVMLKNQEERSKILNEHWRAEAVYNKRFSAERATILYSIAAHRRGKLHITKRWEPNYQSDGGRVLVTKTMDDQLKLIESWWKEFELIEEDASMGSQTPSKAVITRSVQSLTL